MRAEKVNGARWWDPQTLWDRGKLYSSRKRLESHEVFLLWNFGSRSLFYFLRRECDDKHPKLKFVLPFGNITSVLLNESDQGNSEIILTLRCAPDVYEFQEVQNNYSDYSSQMCTCVESARFLVHHISFPPDSRPDVLLALETLKEMGPYFGLSCLPEKLEFGRNISLISSEEIKLYHQPPFLYTSQSLNIDMQTRYTIKCLLCERRAIPTKYHLTVGFWKVYFSLTRHAQQYWWTYLRRYSGLLPLFDLELLIKDHNAWNPPVKAPIKRVVDSTMAIINHVYVTPSRIIPKHPTCELSCRLLREFPNHHDSFLRVTFKNEEQEFIHFSEKILQRAREVVMSGRIIHVGDKNFIFLTSTPSQMRSGSCWMFSETPDLTLRTVMQRLGDFQNIKNVAQLSARRAQCFSSTIPTFIVEDDEYIDLPNDIVTIDKKGRKFCFSDGVGLMSLSGARRIQEVLKLPHLPSSVQFRFKDRKGMLSLYPQLEVEYDRPGLLFAFRPSQIKGFRTFNQVFEICDLARYQIGHCNKEIITLLHNCGIEKSRFQKILTKMQKDLNASLEDTQGAMNMIRDYGDPRVQFLNDLLLGGLPFNSEFMHRCLCSIASSKLHQLKTKLRIVIPNSAFLFGILDEYGVLEENECFVKICNKEGREFVQVGWVVIVKNPAKHRGDLRLLRAVDKPELHHLSNNIVFSQKGIRPVPDQCSGSDLDGDQFTVIWNEELASVKQTFKPCDYTPAPKQEISEITPFDEKDFFLQGIEGVYMLGTIANACAVVCDKIDQGPNHKDALLLAKLFSKQVDFPKTGQPVRLPPRLKPKAYPHYMQKDAEMHTVYRSTNICGLLYDMVKVPETLPPLKSLTKPLRDLLEPQFHHPEFDKYLHFSYEEKREWDSQLRSVIESHKLHDEFDTVTFSFMNKRRFDVREKIFIEMESIVRTFRKRFSEFDSNEERTMRAKASAYYCVTQMARTQQTSELQGGPMISFAWVLAHEQLITLMQRDASQHTAWPMDIPEPQSLPYFNIGDGGSESMMSNSDNYSEGSNVVPMFAKGPTVKSTVGEWSSAQQKDALTVLKETFGRNVKVKRGRHKRRGRK